jgi:hypothetical protein
LNVLWVAYATHSTLKPVLCCAAVLLFVVGPADRPNHEQQHC